MSPRALVIASKFLAARFLRSTLSFENAISMGFKSGETGWQEEKPSSLLSHVRFR